MRGADVRIGGDEVLLGTTKVRIGTDEINRLILVAEGRRTILRSQFPVQLDDIGERLSAELRVFDWWRQRHFLASAFDELRPREASLNGYLAASAWPKVIGADSRSCRDRAI